MPKRLENYINASFFHIMVQGLNKEYIFNSNIDKDKYLKITSKIKSEVNLDIIAYCVMSNHIHLLIKTERIEELSKFMQRVNTLYARYYNKKYNRVGYVYRDRYKSQIIYSEKQLYTCINYIHNNPVKARICKFPDEYEYSSFKTYSKNLEFFEKYIGNGCTNQEGRCITFLEDEGKENKKSKIL